jgi:TPR repeat protein
MNRVEALRRTVQPVLPPSHRGPGRVALDLWRAGGSFRGFTEFALIGGVVLAFLLTGGGSMKLGGGRQIASPGTGISQAPPAKPATDFKTPLAPRISDVGFDVSYFDDVAEPLRAALVASYKDYYEKLTREAEQRLLKANSEHPKVLLMRGLITLANPNRESLNNGIGHLERAVAKGEPRAMAILGVIKLAGTPGYPRDTDGGRNLLERAVAAGDAAAPRILGDGFISGWAGTVDPGRARQYLELGSDRGDAKAAFRLAEMLITGHGVPKDEIEAERLIVKAAQGGHVEAIAAVGSRRLLHFMSGLTDDPDDALRLLELAAAQNEPHAMYYLGMFYVEYGRRIGRLDLPRGVDLFRRCSEATMYVECLYAYGTSLELGLGVARDPVRAYAMYTLAGSSKKNKATDKRDEIAKTLSGEDMVRANVIATQLVQNAKASKMSGALP